MTTRRIHALALLAAASCSAEQANPPTDAGDGGVRCRSNADCNDNLDCTVDSCGVGRVCEFQPIDALCTGAGETCIPGRGCIANACRSSDQCNDDIDCTTDTCGVGGTCEFRPLDVLCGAGMRCEPGTGCVPAGECLVHGDCNDRIDCTEDRCEVGYRCAIIPHDDRCTGAGERCEPSIGCFEYRPCPGGTDAECDDGRLCNGRERCTPEFGCRPATVLPDCADTDPCTADRCDDALNMCVNEIDPSIPGCAPFDINGCFSVVPVMQQRCALGYVNYNITQVCFSQIGRVLEAIAGPFTLSGPHEPSDYAFDVVLVISGDCEETYRIQGEFSDDNRFAATWTAQFVPAGGGVGCFDCTGRTIRFTGTRM
ncbi:MAG: hypothetical protein QME96_16150 [Myxococcota bacterium]|nr:hypothetical protein [Myxococcota bacterium]